MGVPDLFLSLGFLPIAALLLLIRYQPFRRESVEWALRSRRVNGGVFAAGALCFLQKVSTLGDADFGAHRSLLVGLFGLLALASLIANYGFLGVRGLAILQLLWANAALDICRGCFSLPWLVFKFYAYACVCLAIYLTLYPYRLRDWLLPEV
jgi:hypothetical protein